MSPLRFFEKHKHNFPVKCFENIFKLLKKQSVCKNDKESLSTASSVPFILDACTFGMSRVVYGLRDPSPPACALGQATVFSVNAALVASQGQHRV